MKFYKLSGHSVYKNIEKYRIDWDKKSRSKFQFEIKQFLRQYWEDHVCYEEMNCAGTRLSIDIVNMTRKIAVEAHGIQHEEYSEFFHGGSRNKFFNQIQRDLNKQEWCDKNGIEMVEVYSDDIPLTEDWFLKNYDIKL